MRVSKRILFVVVVFVWGLCGPNSVAAQESDQVIADQIAERVLGREWKQLSRRAGMIFAGTVVGKAALAPPFDNAALTNTAQRVVVDQPVSRMIPSIQFTLRVDRAIIGVEAGQVLTIHEWSGASFVRRPLVRGQRILIFLYAPSRLGLTSPVGGASGEIALEANGMTAREAGRNSGDVASVSVLQLERAIRSAREE